MRPPEEMLIYNLFPLLAGRFSQWESHLKRASDMGFNWVFINPIQRPGKSGSLYSIADYNAFNPLFIDGKNTKPPAEQLKDITDKASSMGLKLMVDLVINHCAVDSDLVASRPEWFLWDAKGKVAHPFCNENGKKIVWKDLAKFDYKHTSDLEGLFQFFFDLVISLVDWGFSGFRCDAAYQVPKKFWERLIRKTKKEHPHVRFFAETLGCQPDQTSRTAKAGFDYIFNSAKWWDFNSHWLMKQYALTREIAPSIGFPESHDTARLCNELKGKTAGLKQRYFFTALFSAGVMMPIGFEYGFKNRLHVVKTRPQDWETPTIDLTSYIKNVNTLKRNHPVFQEEAPTEILSNNNPELLIMWKGSPTTREEALIILNKDLADKQHFEVKDLSEYVQAGAPLVDISPEYAMDFIPVPFSYDLRPGQGMVLITTRDPIENDDF